MFDLQIASDWVTVIACVTASDYWSGSEKETASDSSSASLRQSAFDWAIEFGY